MLLIQLDLVPDEIEDEANVKIPGFNYFRPNESIDGYRTIINQNLVQIVQQMIKGAKKLGIPWGRKSLQVSLQCKSRNFKNLFMS